jgi:hypothetical protein
VSTFKVEDKKINELFHSTTIAQHIQYRNRVSGKDKVENEKTIKYKRVTLYYILKYLGISADFRMFSANSEFQELQHFIYAQAIKNRYSEDI